MRCDLKESEGKWMGELIGRIELLILDALLVSKVRGEKLCELIKLLTNSVVAEISFILSA